MLNRAGDTGEDEVRHVVGGDELRGGRRRGHLAPSREHGDHRTLLERSLVISPRPQRLDADIGERLDDGRDLIRQRTDYPEHESP